MDYTDVIKDLLSKNITPEKIYQTALDELKKIQAENEKKEKEKKAITQARDELTDALVQYLFLVYPDISFGTPDELANSIEKSLEALEKSGGNAFKINFGNIKDLEKKIEEANAVFDRFLKKRGY